MSFGRSRGIAVGSLLLPLALCPALAGAHAADAPADVALQPTLMLQLGHSGTVTAAAFSPDERLLLTGGLDHSAILWEVSSGKSIRRFLGHSDAVSEVAFSPEGDRIATASTAGTVRIWDPASGKAVRTEMPR